MKNWLAGSILLFASLWTDAWGTVYELPADGSAVVGTDERIKSTYKDTLLDIAHRYSLGYEEIIRANPGDRFDYQAMRRHSGPADHIGEPA